MAAKAGPKDSVKMLDLSSSSFKKRKVDDAPVKAEDSADPTPTTAEPMDVDDGKVVVEHKATDMTALGVYSSGDEWPFEGLCEQLCLDLFSPAWEIRHGAAIGLRELLKVHGTGIGRIVGLARDANQIRHRAWTEDLAVRLLCVLALDRFADFVGDQAVLPVRETCAQTLGVLMQFAEPELCLHVVNKGLIPLIGDPNNHQSHVAMANALLAAGSATTPNAPQPSQLTSGSWEIRHSALIGLKFWMAVRQDLLDKVLVPPPGADPRSLSPVFLAILNGLKDSNDDVRAVSSSALIPVADIVVKLLPADTIFRTLVMSLWDCLQELDDLTSATSFVMDLLSNLVTKPSIAAIMRNEASDFFERLVPQLFPFFRHAIASVRSAVIRTLSSLVDLTESDPSSNAGSWISLDLLRLVFQNFVLEESAKIVDASLELWTKLARFMLRVLASTGASPAAFALAEELPKGMMHFFALLMTAIGTPIDQSHFVQFASAGRRANPDPPAAPAVAAPPAKGKRGQKKQQQQQQQQPPPPPPTLKHSQQHSQQQQQQQRQLAMPVQTDPSGLNISLQDRAMVQQDLTVVSADAILYGRIAGATAMGRLVHTLCKSSIDPIRAKVTELLSGYASSAWAAHRVFGAVVVEEWAHEWRAQSSAGGSGGGGGGGGLLDADRLAAGVWEGFNAHLASANAGASLLYLELLPSLQAVWQECYALLRVARDARVGGVPPLPPMPTGAPTNPRLMQNVQSDGPLGPVFTVQVCEFIVSQLYPMITQALPSHGALPERHARLTAALEAFKAAQLRHDTQVHAATASTVVALDRLPAKLNPIIRALMNSVKTEENEQMQRRSARAVARMILLLNVESLSASSKGGPVNDKITRNLCVFLCADPETVGEAKTVRDRAGIITTQKAEAASARALAAMSGSGRGRKKAAGAGAGAGATATATATAGNGKAGTPTAEAVEAHTESVDMAASAAVAEASKAAENEAQMRAHRVTCRGAEAAIASLCEAFGPDLLAKLPKLWEAVSAPLAPFAAAAAAAAAGGSGSGPECGTGTGTGAGADSGLTIELDPDDAQTQPLLDGLHVLEVMVKYAHAAVGARLLDLARPVSRCLRASLALARHLAARCLASMCRVLGVPAVKVLISDVIPLASDSTSELHRQGAVECIHHVVHTMEDQVLPYLVFLIVPLLGRMSDSDEAVRFASTHVFAQLVKLAPLESGVADPAGFTAEMTAQKREERKFIGQLIGTEKVASYEVPVDIRAELRPYQKEGVSWLAFLNRYGLQGILCDDMGLGKTLQSICMMAADHFYRDRRFKETAAPDAAHCPSLVVCPSTLTGHWFFEIQKYAPFLRPFLYVGDKQERTRHRKKLASFDIIISSYESVRSDIEDLGAMRFNYLVLDEGHVIKNPNSKLTKAVKSVPAFHRLILSGTPIQNNVLELWSLFDFLMPGFLGTEAQFNERFGKPILASRDAKASSREQERGALALEALHKQVLPFLMRRMKEDVLDDLPPKIIQDYYCELSDVQKMLYESFARSEARQSIEEDLGGDGDGDGDGNVKTEDGVVKKEAKAQASSSSSSSAGGGGKPQHIFQALQYLRKVCNHPSLVLTPTHPQYRLVTEKLAKEKRSIHDLENAPKILALQQLLKDCGIGADGPGSGAGGSSGSGGGGNGISNDSAAASSATAPHRALIFAQVKTMLDIIETDLFKALMPSVTYMRLDGTTDSIKRHELVTKFNEDPSIDVLLLTTHVGGLGLNLTGADTVIFVEHDWNPMKDLQAMDRAHRIGQKRVVNVYRLITRGTLEEKIMGLQKFKLNIASSVINQDNSGIASMDTSQILDLFTLEGDSRSSGGGGGGGGGGGAGASGGAAKTDGKVSAKKALEGLDALWDESQYDDMNVDDFLKKLK
nr:TATA-binding protein-associated factor mot1 [Polyrhizophydium stewartii]